MNRSSGKTLLPGWMRRASRRQPVPVAALPAPAPHTPPAPAASFPASPVDPGPWEITLGTVPDGTQPVTVDLERDAHLLLEGEAGCWPGGYVVETLTEAVFSHQASLIALFPEQMAPPLYDHPRLTCLTHHRAAGTVEAFHASMQTALAPSRPAEHRFLLIHGLDLLRNQAADDARLQRALDELLLQIVLMGGAVGHHVLAYDWTPPLADADRRAPLRAAFPAVLQQADNGPFPGDRAVLLSTVGAWDLVLTQPQRHSLT
ncbi:hypothetical protein ACFY2W_36100 [Streptomyces sp. NPDC001262]|uniref:hypothetical protein n=1 Tax=Streptomyces sp. NPDC001262 TaxID=3364552 RepID=UPI00368AEB35